MKAFPTEHAIAGTMDFHADGMDLRDYFAAKAMMIVIKEWKQESDEMPYLDETGEPMSYEEGSSGIWFPHTIFFAKSCYAIADVMMEARNK